MKFVIQRVLNSYVKVEGETIGAIGKGFMVLIGVCENDTKEIADKLFKFLGVLTPIPAEYVALEN
ncbi:MAG: D-aminoacyl-tRNA deacylase [Lachnospiraceae bacterium]|nr:D-aminoacyl-tRNA deacylase [Lachnospiraceae bacterium]